MHQCNGLDYAFLTKPYKNTSYINSFFFLKKNDSFDYVGYIKNCIKESIKKEYLFQAVLSEPIRKNFLPCFFESQEKINIDDHLTIKSINYTKENFHEYLETIYSKPMNLTKPLWEVYLLELTDQKTIAFIIRIHHSLGDGSVVNRMIKSVTKINYKRRSTKVKNNKIFCSLLVFKISLIWIFAKLKNLLTLKKNRLSRNFSKNIFLKKQDNKVYENKCIKFKCLDYSLFKNIIEKNKCTFQSVILYLYSISYKQIAGQINYTAFAAVPLKLKGPRYGSYSCAYLCDLLLDKDGSLNDFNECLKAEKKYVHQKKYYTKINAFLRYPRTNTVNRSWKELMPVMNGAVVSNTPHYSDAIKIGENLIESYWAVPVYPEIEQSLGVSLNTHRSNNQVNITCLSYPDILKYSDKFLDIFEYNLIKLSSYDQPQ